MRTRRRENEMRTKGETKKMRRWKWRIRMNRETRKMRGR